MLDQITGGDSAVCSQLTNEVENDVNCRYANDGECDEPDLCAEVSGTNASIRDGCFLSVEVLLPSRCLLSQTGHRYR